jgi:uroporphyrinogen decarboxylase
MSKKDEYTGKELLLGALKHEKVPAVPWVPYAGVHAGLLKNYTAIEVLKDPDKLFESLMAVNEIYDPDGQPIVFDLQIEAEILGCELRWADNLPPTVMTHPLQGTDNVPDHVFTENDGRLPMILDVCRRMKKSVGDHTALYGLFTGPLTLASHMQGTEIYTFMVRKPERVQPLVDYCTEVAIRMAGFYLDAGMDVIAAVDPVISQISPKHFNAFFAEPYRRMFDFIREKGAYSSFFVCGDATKNIEVMCQTGPDSIAVDENVSMHAAKEVTDRYNVTLGGNIPLSTEMLMGTQQSNMKWVVDFLDSIDHHNLILAPGCDMPYDTPIENTVAVLQAVRDLESSRKMIANYEAPAVDTSGVVVPDYDNLKKPLIEVFTLDSATCAACTYMLGAAMRVAEELPGQVDVIEYKFTTMENVARVHKMGVKNLPSIYINGELKYSSIIPDHEEIMEIVRGLL